MYKLLILHDYVYIYLCLFISCLFFRSMKIPCLLFYAMFDFILKFQKVYPL